VLLCNIIIILIIKTVRLFVNRKVFILSYTAHYTKIELVDLQYNIFKQVIQFNTNFRHFNHFSLKFWLSYHAMCNNNSTTAGTTKSSDPNDHLRWNNTIPGIIKSFWQQHVWNYHRGDIFDLRYIFTFQHPKLQTNFLFKCIAGRAGFVTTIFIGHFNIHCRCWRKCY
jgi:hypothetical protein